jgi:hypothetical protein
LARKARIEGQATDWAGMRWDVREYRPTAHGFDVLVGWPKGEPRGRGGRGVATILTVELAQYLTATRSRDVELPIGGTTVKRLRTKVGLRWSWDDWWAAREVDLLTMTLECFCATHGCSIGATSQRRTKLRDL